MSLSPIDSVSLALGMDQADGEVEVPPCWDVRGTITSHSHTLTPS